MCDDLFMAKKHDPGGKVHIVLTPDVKTKAVFGGPGDCYRYRPSRTWNEKKPHALFVMMNPSTADLKVDDPTVAKCGRFARAWGYGGIHVGNTFAYRATDKKHLRLIADPIGPDNDKPLGHGECIGDRRLRVRAAGPPHLSGARAARGTSAHEKSRRHPARVEALEAGNPDAPSLSHGDSQARPVAHLAPAKGCCKARQNRIEPSDARSEELSQEHEAVRAQT
jgi:hypothetical protein